MLQVFNSQMEPIKTHEEYPKYARSETKPVIRARLIIDNGVISNHPVRHFSDLLPLLLLSTLFYSPKPVHYPDLISQTLSMLTPKCASAPLAWNSGKIAFAGRGRSASAHIAQVRIRSRSFVICRVKRLPRRPRGGNGGRCKIPAYFALNVANRVHRTGNIYAPSGDAASNADTMMSGTLVSETFASGLTPFSAIPMSGARSVRKSAQSPGPTSAMTGTIDTRVVQPAAPEAGSQATLERVTALENQVSRLEAEVMELLVKLEEVSSCVSTTATPQPQAAAGASPAFSNITFGDLQAQQLADAQPPAGVAITVRRATRDWVEGPKTLELPLASSPVPVATSVKVEEPETAHASSPLQVALSHRVEELKTAPTLDHTFEHPEGYKPVNCSYATSGSRETEAVLPKGADPGAQTDMFSALEIASRGNLF